MTGLPNSRSVWVLQHVPSEGSGVFGQWLQEEGVPITIHHLATGAPVPQEIATCRGLIVMGGPMNVDETQQHPWLAHETQLIQQVAKTAIPIVGVCLGAQLIAHALGGHVYRAARSEIGWCDVESTEAGADDGLFAAFPRRYTVLQWHRYTYELPAGAVQLARSDACEQQAFRSGATIYAMQYHMEVTASMVETWLADPVMTAGGVDVAALRAGIARYVPQTEILARQFYSCWRTLLR
jgi:GMP synthase (glutamine-hydrolysing)